MSQRKIHQPQHIETNQLLSSTDSYYVFDSNPYVGTYVEPLIGTESPLYASLVGDVLESESVLKPGLVANLNVAGIGLLPSPNVSNRTGNEIEKNENTINTRLTCS